MNILGISAYYHDSAAALIQNGIIRAAIQEERFTRVKHDSSFPARATLACLDIANVAPSAIDYVVFYDKPLLKFERLLETYLAYSPRGIRSFVAAMPVWLKEKLFLKQILRKEVTAVFNLIEAELPPLLFSEHHQSHAASAFYPSPFNEAAVLCLDGVGEWATSSLWLGNGATLKPKWEIQFPHSLGLLYSAFTYFTGFKVNSGEYKLMGLAPYGEPKYFELIMENLIDVKPDGTFRLNMDYFNYATGLTMTNSKFDRLFDGPPRVPESSLTSREMDIAASIQKVVEEVVLRLARGIHKEYGLKNLCLAGGVALNCVANGRLSREGPFSSIWVQPAAGDAGGAIGSALSVWYEYLQNPRTENNSDSMSGSYLGPHYSNSTVVNYLDSIDAIYERLEDSVLMPRLAKLLDAGHVIGWYQGPMEFGPRALGGRSIIGDPRNPQMQSTMNLKIKYRESFRPFAPAILKEKADQFFDINDDSPYMLMVAPIKKEFRFEPSEQEKNMRGIDKLKRKRSVIPAVTHVDYSARVQTVDSRTNPRFHDLLMHFDALTGCPALVNTSFNVRGEPIVCSPQHAYECFMRTEMDFLVMENCLLKKNEQPPTGIENRESVDTFALD